MKKSRVLSRAFVNENLQMPVLSRDFFFMLLLFIVFIPSTFNQTINAVSLYVIMPFLFIYSLYRSLFLFRKFRYFRLFILLFCWALLSGIVAVDKDLYWSEISKLAGSVMFTFILIRFSWNNSRYIYYFYVLYIIKFLYIFFYAYQNGLFAIDVTSERFNLDDLNANAFGYFGFFALIGSFLLATYTQKVQKLVYMILFYLVFVLVVISGILAASRGTLLISAVAFILLLMVRYLYPLSRRSILPLILTIASVVVISRYLDSTFQNSLVKTRFDSNEGDRYDLFSRAAQTGAENPILGVGSGNFVLYNPKREFSHNSFAELWANNGVAALVLFVLMLLEVFRNIRQYIKMGGDKKIAYYFTIIWATYCTYNFFYVFYISFSMIAFIFLVSIHIEYSKTNRLKKIMKERVNNKILKEQQVTF
jgi:O-antigen ligase